MTYGKGEKMEIEKPKIIEHISVHYENALIKFKGDEQYYFCSLYDVFNLIKGMKVRGKTLKKRTRHWFMFEERKRE